MSTSPKIYIKPSSLAIDPTTWLLLLSNATTFYFAVTQRWPFSYIALVFLGQTVIIGIISLIKVITLPRYTHDTYVNTPPELISTQERWFTFVFVSLFYGTMTFCYGGLLLTAFIVLPPNGVIIEIPWKFIWFSILLFAINHTLSFVLKWPAERHQTAIVSLSLQPFARALPMFLILCLGIFFIQNATLTPVIIFLTLKTIVDILGHLITHLSYKT